MKHEEIEKIMINQIQHFSLHDGSGIRTTIFLQGCNLRCQWCHNPETWDAKNVVSYDSSRCVGCMLCKECCPVHAHVFTTKGHDFERAKCIRCGRCVEVCCSGALEMNGRYENMEELYQNILRDRKLYNLSGGGVTFSGGEPLLQPDALSELCKRLAGSDINIAIETALCLPWNVVERCAEHVSLFLVDLKIFDDEVHKRYTGKSNRLIKENLKKLVKMKDTAVRIPVIKNVNDDRENAENAAEFLSTLNPKIQSVELLPYHDFGIAKANRIGVEQRRFQEPEDEQMKVLSDIYRSYNIPVV